MTILDRYILKHFLSNFVLLFLVLFLFSCIIDLFVNIDSFVEATTDLDPEGQLSRIAWGVQIARMIFDFYTPRFFQFYTFLVGFVSIGATGFTLVQLHRHRELTAVMAAGVSLHRIAMPIIAAVLFLNVLQFANRELIVPHYAPALLRSHGELGSQELEAYRVRMLKDSDGKLFYANRYYPDQAKLEGLVVFYFDQDYRLIGHISATEAAWDATDSQWILENGRHVSVARSSANEMNPMVSAESIQTDLDPTRLLLYRHHEYRQMLNLRQIAELIPAAPDDAQRQELYRIQYGRFAQILINLLTLLATLPFFLLRSPKNLLMQSVYCAGLGIFAQVGGAVGTAIGFPGISPAASVFLFPLLFLLPISVALMGKVET